MCGSMCVCVSFNEVLFLVACVEEQANWPVTETDSRAPLLPGITASTVHMLSPVNTERQFNHRFLSLNAISTCPPPSFLFNHQTSLYVPALGLHFVTFFKNVFSLFNFFFLPSTASLEFNTHVYIILPLTFNTLLDIYDNNFLSYCNRNGVIASYARAN